MLNVGRDSLGRGEWWITFFPGFAIFLFVMAINLVGDGVRDAFDPQGKSEQTEGGMR
jgi:peptide/nickel transport system permease protein